MDKLDKLILETLAEGIIEDSLENLNVENNRKFMRMLKLLHDIKKPSEQLIKVNLSNIKQALESIIVLLRHRYKPSEALLQRLYEMRRLIESVLDKYGMEGEIGKQLRKLYLSVQAYLKFIEKKYPYSYKKGYAYPTRYYRYPKKYKYPEKYPERTETELSRELFNPGMYYRECVEKDKAKVFKALREGLSPLLETIDKPKNDREYVESLARSDVIYWSMHGVLPEREDLSFMLGYKSRGEKADELMLEGINKLEERERKRRLDTAKYLEGIKKEDMSIPNWLSSRIKKRLEKF